MLGPFIRMCFKGPPVGFVKKMKENKFFWGFYGGFFLGFFWGLSGGFLLGFLWGFLGVIFGIFPGVIFGGFCGFVRVTRFQCVVQTASEHDGFRLRTRILFASPARWRILDRIRFESQLFVPRFAHFRFPLPAPVRLEGPPHPGPPLCGPRFTRARGPAHGARCRSVSG